MVTSGDQRSASSPASSSGSSSTSLTSAGRARPALLDSTDWRRAAARPPPVTIHPVSAHDRIAVVDFGSRCTSLPGSAGGAAGSGSLTSARRVRGQRRHLRQPALASGDERLIGTSSSGRPFSGFASVTRKSPSGTADASALPQRTARRGWRSAETPSSGCRRSKRSG
jgi:hypothetical protein